jgi:hypothetical protein
MDLHCSKRIERKIGLPVYLCLFDNNFLRKGRISRDWDQSQDCCIGASRITVSVDLISLSYPSLMDEYTPPPFCQAVSVSFWSTQVSSTCFSAMLLCKAEALEMLPCSSQTLLSQTPEWQSLRAWGYMKLSSDLMVTSIFSQGMVVCNLCYSITGWLDRTQSSEKPYHEGN